MNRRKFFRFLPLTALAMPAMASAAISTTPDPSPWVEMTCQREAKYMYHTEDDSKGYLVVRAEVLTPSCGTRFKFLRIGVTPYCPKCGWAQDMSRDPELRALISGIEV